MDTDEVGALEYFGHFLARLLVYIPLTVLLAFGITLLHGPALSFHACWLIGSMWAFAGHHCRWALKLNLPDIQLVAVWVGTLILAPLFWICPMFFPDSVTRALVAPDRWLMNIVRDRRERAILDPALKEQLDNAREAVQQAERLERLERQNHRGHDRSNTFNEPLERAYGQLAYWKGVADSHIQKTRQLTRKEKRQRNRSLALTTARREVRERLAMLEEGQQAREQVSLDE